MPISRVAGVTQRGGGRRRIGPTCQEAAAPRRGRAHRNHEPTSEGGDKRNGEEDGQGREEEGRQEAVSHLTRQKRGRPSPPFLRTSYQFPVTSFQLPALGPIPF